MITALAPAKINLCLHVTGQRDDGYHLISSLVVFADLGEHLRLAPGAESLSIIGPEAAGLRAAPDNLILRAAHFAGLSARFTLHKTMPISSGIGGGSSDAAAALRGLAHLHSRPPAQGSAAIGADLPMCLAATPCLATGIGDQITPLPALPDLWLVLANPRLAIATPDVFSRLSQKSNPPPPPFQAQSSAAHFAAYLRETRNDLTGPAQEICPQIKEVLGALAAQTPLLARMSGSGATCFALFSTASAAENAAARIGKAQPGWWVRAAQILDAQPQLIRATT